MHTDRRTHGELPVQCAVDCSTLQLLQTFAPLSIALAPCGELIAARNASGFMLSSGDGRGAEGATAAGVVPARDAEAAFAWNIGSIRHALREAEPKRAVQRAASICLGAAA